MCQAEYVILLIDEFLLAISFYILWKESWTCVMKKTLITIEFFTWFSRMFCSSPERDVAVHNDIKKLDQEWNM